MIRRVVIYAPLFIATLLILLFVLAPLPAHAQTVPADQSYLQTAGHAVSGPTIFATDLYATNATGDPVDISIIFKPVNSQSGWVILPTRIHLGPYERKELIDPLPGFGINGIGMLIFNPCLAGADCSPVIDHTSNPHAPRYYEHSANYRAVSIVAIIRSRWNDTRLFIGGNPVQLRDGTFVRDATKLGTHSESYPAIPWYDIASVEWAAGGRDKPFITGIHADGHYHTNLSVANGSQFSTTVIEGVLYDGLGVARGEWSASLGPLDNRQMSAEDMFPVLRESRMNRQPPVRNPWVRFEQREVVPTADAAAYGCDGGCPGFLVQGSAIDALSTDGMLLVGQFETGNQSFEVAAALGETSGFTHVAQAAMVPTVLPSRPAISKAVSPLTARINDVLHFHYIGSQCSIKPDATVPGLPYLVSKPDGQPWTHISVGELDKVRTMCGAVVNGGAQ